MERTDSCTRPLRIVSFMIPFPYLENGVGIQGLRGLNFLASPFSMFRGVLMLETLFGYVLL
jgi:hypothetical protein